MSNKYQDHSKDKYIVGGVALILIIVAVIAFIVTGSASQPNTTPIPSISVEVGTSTVATSTAPASGSPGVSASAAVTALAKCLAAKGVAMYGAYWCSHCQNQKKAFGDAFKYVPYIECTQNTQLCLDKGVQGYPAWILPNGQKLEGEQTLVKLAEVSSCSYKP